MILDYYFRRPVTFDYFFGIISITIVFILHTKNYITLPSTEDSFSLTSDLTNITLTMAGFILTILTVLITFKDNSTTNTIDSNKTEGTQFKRFFDTEYYPETIKHLKNCIQSIILVAAIGFLLKIFCPIEMRYNLFYYNVFGLVITVLTVWRCLLILTKILELQTTPINNKPE